MSNLEELTEKIKTRLSEQNQILKDCVQKYQNSQKERKDIANQIQNITSQLTTATNNLETIQKNHIDFRNARAKKLQEYEQAQQKMQNDFENEKKGLEEKQQKAAEDARQREQKLKSDLEEGAKKHEEEQLRIQKEAADKAASEKEEQHQLALKEQERKVEESKGQIKEFSDKLKNTQEEAKKQQEILETQHKNDVLAAKTNEEKILTLTNQVNDLYKKIEDLTTTHTSQIEELNTKSGEELEKLRGEQETALTTQKQQLEELHKAALKEHDELHNSSMEQLRRQQELKTKASNDTARAETEDLKNKLQQCEEKFNKSEELYEANKVELNKIQEEFKTAETTAANALKQNVDKLAEENKKLQAQIQKMLGEAKTDVDVANMPAVPSLDSNSGEFGGLLQGQRPELRKMIYEEDGLAKKAENQKSTGMDPNQFWSKMVEMDEFKDEEGNDRFPDDDEMKILKKIWLEHLTSAQSGGYKHGKRSNKRMKRSLKSKLTAKKFSLKKRSKRKKKGKSKKRRKSIKIRI